MKPEEQIKALAELDGWNSLGQDAEIVEYWIQYPREVISRLSYDEIRKQRVWSLPNYLTSYDAIIPLIKKQDYNVKAAIYNFFTREDAGWTTCAVSMLEATPDELCEALLRATENWKE